MRWLVGVLAAALIGWAVVAVWWGPYSRRAELEVRLRPAAHPTPTVPPASALAHWRGEAAREAELEPWAYGDIYDEIASGPAD